MKEKILVVEDETAKRLILTDALNQAGYKTESVEDGNKALEMINNQTFDLILLDLKLPGIDGMSILKEVKTKSPETEVIIMTAYGTIQNAVEAMRFGAYDYITKPFTPEELLLKVERIFEYSRQRQEYDRLKRLITDQFQFGNIVGKSKVMLKIFQQLEIISQSDTTVLIEGETGTGKELIANMVHFNSPRKDKPFVPLSCVALTETLIESELFGHERGAFSGALQRKRGRFELADTGTLFLDEIDDIPLSLQPKLLRVLQDKKFYRVGGEEPIQVDVRLIAATKQSLRALVLENKFRDDLYYRISTITIRIPPLRERKEDIPVLIDYFIRKSSNNQKRHFSPELINLVMDYYWPGNVRELENFVEGVLVISRDSVLTPRSLPQSFLKILRGEKAERLEPEVAETGLNERIKAYEKELISNALKTSGGNLAKASRILKIPRTTLRDRIKKLNIDIGG